MAQADYFLKVDGVEGESTDVRHPGAIELLSFSWLENASASRPGSGGGAGKVEAGDLQFVKRVDKSSPALMQACATGKRFRKAVLTARKPSAQPFEFLTITFDDVVLTSYQIAAAVGVDSSPTEQLSVRIGTIEVAYREQRPDGSAGTELKSGFDFVQNRPF